MNDRTLILLALVAAAIFLLVNKSPSLSGGAGGFTGQQQSRISNPNGSIGGALGAGACVGLGAFFGGPAGAAAGAAVSGGCAAIGNEAQRGLVAAAPAIRSAGGKAVRALNPLLTTAVNIGKIGYAPTVIAYKVGKPVVSAAAGVVTKAEDVAGKVGNKAASLIHSVSSFF